MLMLFKSKLDKIAYIIMLIQTIMSPGIITIVYPLTIFGYALLQQKKPPKEFFTIILIYT